MRKQVATTWLYKIYRMLEDTQIRFTLNRRLKVFGMTTIFGDAPAAIQVNPEKKEFMSTIVHECLHLVDWDLAEAQVVTLERGLMKHLTDRQLLNLLRRIVMFHTKNI